MFKGKSIRFFLPALMIMLVLPLMSFRNGLNLQMEQVLRDIEESVGYVNTHTDEEIAKMASWFMDHGTESQKARALYCLGRNEFNSKRYSAAMVTYTRALEHQSDSLVMARIYYGMAKTCAATMNISDQIMYLEHAAACYEAVGFRKDSQNCLLEIGKAEMDTGQMENAEKIFKSILGESHDLRDTLLEAHCLEAYASLAVQKDTADPALAIDLLSRAADQLHFRLKCADKGILAYSYSLIGNDSEAQKWLSEAKASAESPAEEADAAFREYQVCSRNGQTAKALAALEKVVGYGNDAQTSVLGETVAASQREYFQSENEMQAEKLKAARLKIWLISLAALLALITLGLIAYMHRKEEERKLAAEAAEKDRYMSIAEDLRRQIAESEAPSSTKTDRKIPWNVDTLERLCEQYYIYEGTENLKPKILKEVKSIVEGLRSDASVQKSLEDMLNEKSDGVMTKLRAEFPAWKDEDFLLYMFIATGFSPTTISTLLEKDKKVIYNRVWRLKNRISDSDAPHKALFLSCME